MAFAFWFLRYVFTLVVFILGIKAPGIRQEFSSRFPIGTDEEALDPEVEIRTSHSQGEFFFCFLENIEKIQEPNHF